MTVYGNAVGTALAHPRDLQPWTTEVQGVPRTASQVDPGQRLAWSLFRGLALHPTVRAATLRRMEITFPLRTRRLLIRPFEDRDAEDMQSVYGDPEVMRYVGNGGAISPDETAALLRSYRQHQREHGYAVWAVIDPGLATPIGDVGFAMTEHGIELGYTLGRRWWARGLATEAARRCIELASETLALPRLVAIADVANPASAHVLTKLGFRHERVLMAYGRPHQRFSLEVPSAGQGSRVASPQCPSPSM